MNQPPRIRRTPWKWVVVAFLLFVAVCYGLVSLKRDTEKYAAAERLVGEGHKLLSEIRKRSTNASSPTLPDVSKLAVLTSNKLASYPVLLFPETPEIITYRINDSFGISVDLNGGVRLIKLEDAFKRFLSDGKL